MVTIRNIQQGFTSTSEKENERARSFFLSVGKVKTARAFTLIELLVVIAIIGILSSVVLASLSTARLKSRDARRLSDMRQLQTALELYYSVNNSYPGSATTNVSTDLATLAPANIPVIPKDPQDPGAHSSPSNYRYCANTQNYVLLATLERTNSWCSVSTGADPCGWSSAFPACGP